MQWVLINKIMLIKYLRVWDWSCSKLDGLLSSQCSRSGLKSVWIFGQKVFNPDYWSQERLPLPWPGWFWAPQKHLPPKYPFLNNSAPNLTLTLLFAKKQPLHRKDLLLFKRTFCIQTPQGSIKTTQSHAQEKKEKKKKSRFLPKIFVGFCVPGVKQQLQGSSTREGETCVDLGVTTREIENIRAESSI